MAKIEIRVLYDIETKQIQMHGPLEAKPLVCEALASAIIAVINHVPPVIRSTNAHNGFPKG